MPQEAALTHERHTHRSRKSLLALLVAILAIGVATPSAYATSQASASLRGLRPGTSGPAVRHLQKMLAHLGYVVRADGQFGGHTANVVRSFRAAAGLPCSGTRSTAAVATGAGSASDASPWARRGAT
jgi:peptidoglycan hydrolase-like protein with peptidoglycan-binding domain